MVDLYERTEGIDPASVLAAVSDSNDVQAHLAAADVEALQGAWSEAFARLIDAIRMTSGDERELVRNRLVELFTLAGDDPAVPKARTALASALF
jgi:putative thioredoxin